jgi:ATP-binding cassette subfamily C (CFTR/MRP) protein 1
LLLLWANFEQPRGSASQVSIAASTLNLLDAVALCMLSFQEHRKSLRPSTLISLYLLFSIACDAVQCRTLWLLPSENGLRSIAAVLSAGIAVKVGMLLLEAKQKREFLIPPWRASSPEALSGVIGRSFFWWLNALMAKGFNNSLSLEMLWPTDHSMDSEKLLASLTDNWVKKGARDGKHALAKACMWTLKWPFLAGLLPRLCLIGFKFSPPLLIQGIVDFVNQVQIQEQREIGYGLIGAAGLIYFGLAVGTIHLDKKPFTDPMSDIKWSVQLQKCSFYHHGSRSPGINGFLQDSHCLCPCQRRERV